ncbi:MAG: hypothetical protein ACI8PZ_002364 [Myxococcota bacterium]|jgi:hypothetical protein
MLALLTALIVAALAQEPQAAALEPEPTPAWRVQGTVMPAPSMSDTGVFLVGDASISHRGRRGMRLDARLSPAILAATMGGAGANGTVTGLVVYDHRLFAIGVGGGMSLGSMYYAGAAPVYAQHLRIGRIDGANLTVYNQFAVDMRWGGYWVADDIDVSIQAPLSDDVKFVLRGQGGSQFGAGTIGVRLRTGGEGERGSWITPHIGAAGGFLDNGRGWRNDIDLAGPVVGFTADARF